MLIYHLRGIYADMNDYKSSVSNFEKAFAIDSAFAQDYYLPYSISLAGCGRFEDALKAVNTFLSAPKLNEEVLKPANSEKKLTSLPSIMRNLILKKIMFLHPKI